MFWSLAAIVHAVAHLYNGPAIPSIEISATTGFAFVTLTSTVAGFSLARFALGLGEAGNFPASIKAVAEWFPKKERALATGLFNSGTNVGALRRAACGAVDHVDLGLGVGVYRHRRARVPLAGAVDRGVSSAAAASASLGEELAYIQSDPIEAVTPVAWSKLLPHRQTWAFAIGKFMTDPIWWLYLFWVPDFLHRVHHIDLKGSALPIFVIYLIATVGSIAGGWLPARLLNRGWTLNAARKTAMLVPALCVLPIMLAPQVSSMWLAVFLIGIAASAHQAWSANIFTFSSDMFPKRAVASVVGIGGMAGAVGGMMIALLVGEILQRTGSYVPIFIMAGSAYLLALGCIHLLVPTIRQVKLDE